MGSLHTVCIDAHLKTPYGSFIAKMWDCKPDLAVPTRRRGMTPCQSLPQCTKCRASERPRHRERRTSHRLSGVAVHAVYEPPRSYSARRVRATANLQCTLWTSHLGATVHATYEPPRSYRARMRRGLWVQVTTATPTTWHHQGRHWNSAPAIGNRSGRRMRADEKLRE